MRLVKFEDLNGDPIYVDADVIEVIRQDEGGDTIIEIRRSEYALRTSVEEVAASVNLFRT